MKVVEAIGQARNLGRIEGSGVMMRRATSAALNGQRPVIYLQTPSADFASVPRFLASHAAIFPVVTPNLVAMQPPCGKRTIVIDPNKTVIKIDTSQLSFDQVVDELDSPNLREAVKLAQLRPELLEDALRTKLELQYKEENFGSANVDPLPQIRRVRSGGLAHREQPYHTNSRDQQQRRPSKHVKWADEEVVPETDYDYVTVTLEPKSHPEPATPAGKEHSRMRVPTGDRAERILDAQQHERGMPTIQRSDRNSGSPVYNNNATYVPNDSHPYRTHNMPRQFHEPNTNVHDTGSRPHYIPVPENAQLPPGRTEIGYVPGHGYARIFHPDPPCTCRATGPTHPAPASPKSTAPRIRSWIQASAGP